MRRIGASVVIMLFIAFTVSSCVLSPVTRPMPTMLGDIPSQFIRTSNSELDAILSLEKRYYCDTDEIVLSVCSTNATQFANAFVMLVPSTLAHNELYDTKEYKTVMIAAMSGSKQSYSMVGYDLGAYDFRLFVDIIIENKTAMIEVGYISFILNEFSGVVTTTPSQTTNQGLSPRMSALYNEYFCADKSLRIKYKIHRGDSFIVVTQGEYDGIKYFEHVIKNKKYSIMCIDNAFYTLLPETKTMFKTSSPTYEKFPSFCAVDISGAISTTGTEKISGVIYEYDDVLTSDNTLIRYYFEFGTSNLSFVRSDGELIQVISYDHNTNSDWFILPDYELIDFDPNK